MGGFFVLSGFLITRSYETVSSVGRFIWHRFLRIFPAFWTCLVVTAFGLAPLAFAYQHGTLHHYFAEIPAPWSYVTSNFLLAIYQQRIGTVFAHVPSPFDTNLSLWTLSPEFFCYLCVAALGIVGVIRRARGGSWHHRTAALCRVCGPTLALRQHLPHRGRGAVRLLRVRRVRLSQPRSHSDEAMDCGTLLSSVARHAYHEGLRVRCNSRVSRI